VLAFVAIKPLAPSTHAAHNTTTAAISPRGKGGRQPEGGRCPGRKTDSRGGTKRETLIDEFSKRDRCFELNFARGVFYFRFLFGDFGAANAAGFGWRNGG
jgi:hypothetical protein